MNQATVYEQQIIRDQGEDFKKRVRKTIKTFDQYENPLRLGIKSVLKEIIESLVPVDAEIQNQLINSCYYRYFTQFEDQHYRFTLQSLNYMFENDKVLQFSSELNYKYITLIFIEQLRAYFQQQNDRNLQRLYQRLEGIKKEKEKDEQEEGFWDDEEETENQSQVTRIKGARNKQKQEDENQFCHTKREMKLKDFQIKSLQTKLYHREQNLVQITSGYLKDIQLLREQLYRKEALAVNFQECYDVTYLDFTEVLDPSIKQLLQLHIKDLKLQFENRTIDYVRVMASQKNELQQLKSQVSKLQNQINNIDAPSELIQKLFKVDDNPYRIWKYIADAKGNLFFKEVFEFQKSVYGINYNEINQLLMTNKGYEREYNNYKESLYSELQHFYTKCSNELTAYKEQYLLAEKQKLEMQENQSNMRLEFLSQAMALFSAKHEEQISILQTQVKNKLELLEHQTLKADQEKLKYMFKLWNVIVKIQKGEELQNILTKQCFIDERLQEKQIEIENQQSQIQHLQKTNQELIVQLVDTQQQLTIINQNQLSWPKQIYELQYAIIKLSNQLRQSTQSKDMLESFNNKLIRIIDSKLSNLKLTEINLDDKSSITKSILDNIKQLSIQQLKQINSIQQTGLFTLQVYVIIIYILQQSLIYNGMINQETQTDPINIQDPKLISSIQEDNFPQQFNSIDSQKYSQSQNQQKSDQKNQSNIQSSQQSEQPAKSQKKKQILNQIHKPSLSQQQQNVENLQENELLSKQDLDKNQSISIQNNKITTQNTSTAIHPESRGKHTGSTLNQSRTIQSHNNKQANHNDIKTTQFKLEQNDQSNVIELIEYEEDQYDKANLKFTSQTERARSRQSRSIVGRTVHYPFIPEKQKNSGEFRDPYKRLYQDSLDKESRIKSLRQNLDLLQKSHWEDIINLFSIEYQGIDKQTQQIQRTVDIPFRQKETTSFRTKCFRQYYEKSKSQTPNQDRYKTWIYKQTNCIDHMFGQIEQVQNQFERVSRTADFQNEGMLPESIRNIMSQKKQR